MNFMLNLDYEKSTLFSSSLIVASSYALGMSMEMNGRKRRSIDEWM
jgi:hypothetical protein